MKLKIFKIFVLVSLFSCSQLKQDKSKAQGPTYSSSTENIFKHIESTPAEVQRKKALKYYRELRRQNKKPAKRKTTPQKVSSPVPRKEAPSVPPKKEILSPKKLKSLEIELEQNMNYFCMKNRLDSRFQSQSDCQQFTENILEDCRKGKKLNAQTLKCLKRKLNL